MNRVGGDCDVVPMRVEERGNRDHVEVKDLFHLIPFSH